MRNVTHIRAQRDATPIQAPDCEHGSFKGSERERRRDGAPRESFALPKPRTWPLRQVESSKGHQH